MKKLITLTALLLCAVVSTWAGDYPDANYLLLNGSTNKKINSSQIGGTGATWSCNTSKYSYGSTTCTFYGNAFSKGLKHESATYTQVVTTNTATLTIVQSLKTNPGGSLDIETVGSDPSDRKDINSFDAENLIVNSYEGEHTVDGKTYKDVKVFKLCNLPAGTYKIYRASANTAQTYVVYMGVTYETVDKVKIATATNNGGESTIEGGKDYLIGATATLTAKPGTGKAFSYWSTNGGTNNVSTDNPYSFTVSAAATYTAVFVDAATKSISVESGNNTAGTAEASATTVSEGNSTTLTATATATGYVFSNWTKSSNGSWTSTTNPLTISYEDLADGDTYTANFKQLYTVTYDIADYKGTSPRVLNNYDAENNINEIYANASDKYTIPSYAHRTLYREGYILTGWTDGVNTYEPGDEITLTGNTTLSPVWTATTQTLASSNAESTVTWQFGKSEILFNGWQGTGYVGYNTKPQTINGELIAVPMIVDASKGKVDNSKRTDANAQINSGTKLTIPAIKGMRITVTRSDNGMTSENTLVGEDGMTVDGKTATYTYTGNESTVTITLNAGGYYSTVAVTYPQTIVTIPVSAASYATFCSDKALDFTGIEDITAYTATKEGNVVKFNKVMGAVPAETGLLVKGVTTNVPVAASAGAVTNIMEGTLTEKTIEDGSFVLLNQNNVIGFYRATGFTARPNSAWLPASVAVSSVRFIGFDDEGGEATGIQEVSTATMKSEQVFNLRGQRVAQPQKGLYIVNGKKVVLK